MSLFRFWKRVAIRAVTRLVKPNDFAGASLRQRDDIRRASQGMLESERFWSSAELRRCCS